MSEKIRNIGIVAHIDAGKTTTTERILYYTGSVRKVGEVHHGNTTTDFLEQERERGITISSASVACQWKDVTINIVDTPGHVDFSVEVQRSLKVLDGAVAVLCGVAGVEAQTESVWSQANNFQVPRLIYVNKLDRVGADFDAVVDEVRDKLASNVICLQYPLFEDNEFCGLFDLIHNVKVIFDDETVEESAIPSEWEERIAEKRQEMIELLCEHDNSLLEEYLEEEDVSIDSLKEVVRKGVQENAFYPVLCGSSFKNIGVQKLLDGIVDYLPSPLDKKEIQVISPVDQNSLMLDATTRDEVLAMVFKVVTDKYLGRLCYVRTYSGALKVGAQVHNVAEKKKEKIQKIFRVQADRRTEIDSVGPGDIVAIPGLKFSKTGHSLIALNSEEYVFENYTFLKPLIKQAIESRSVAEQKKLIEVLDKIVDEDPTFKYSTDEETGQVVIEGVGELHLEVVVDRLDKEFGLQVRVGQPEVSYRERLVNDVELKNDFSTVEVAENLSPIVSVQCSRSTDQSDFGSENAVVVTADTELETKQHIETIVHNALLSGPSYGFPIVESKVQVQVNNDALEVEQETLVRIVFQSVRQAVDEASTVVLEPYFEVVSSVPDENIGAVIDALNVREAKIQGLEAVDNIQIVTCFMPLSKSFGYVTELRSLTKGRGTYTMKFNNYGESKLAL